MNIDIFIFDAVHALVEIATHPIEPLAMRLGPLFQACVVIDSTQTRYSGSLGRVQLRNLGLRVGLIAIPKEKREP